MKGTMILTMGLIAIVTLVGCGGNNPAGPGGPALNTSVSPKPLDARLVGVWRLKADDGAAPLIAFKNIDDVEVTAQAGYEFPVTVSGTYQVDGSKLILKASPAEGEKADGVARSRFGTYTYAFEGDVLSLTSSGGEVSQWEKM